MTQSSASLLLGTEPPPPPRELTGRARWRAWLEPRVRGWWLSAIAMIVMASAYTIGRVPQLARDRWLIRYGTVIEMARIIEIDGEKRERFAASPDQKPRVKMAFNLNGTDWVVAGELSPQRYGAFVGKHIRIIVDPNSPKRWTDRLAIAWFDELLLAVVVAPVVVIMLGIAVVQRKRLLGVWRMQPTKPAVVVRTRWSGFYPRSTLVSLALQNDASGQVVTAAVPNSLGALARGDVINVVVPPTQPSLMLVAALYV